MKHDIRTLGVAALAFTAGLAVARLPLPAHAASAPLTAQAIDLAAMGPADIPVANPKLPDLHTKTLIVTDGMTAAIQAGMAFKHYHADSDEIQIVLSGTGTEWLGDRQMALKPGTMLVIPRGTAHAGFTAESSDFKWVSLKTPPQDPADVHPL
jgi:mannose-6-phosphate isomerase-like protein (cupin superfamily)